MFEQGPGDFYRLRAQSSGKSPISTIADTTER